MKTPTIRLLGISVIAATLVTGVIYVASAFMIRAEIQDSRSIWNNFQRISANRAQSLSSIVSNLGYGGMIYYYKEYIIKGEEELAQKSTLAAGAALAAIERYKASPIDANERAALKTIRTNIMAYMKGLATANEAIMEGETVSDIDKMIKINDVRTLKAFAVLRQSIKSSNSTGNRAADTGNGRSQFTKTEQYGEMLSALGYGGLTHHFKTYIIRRDKPHLPKIKRSISKYRKATLNYRSLGLTDQERKALTSIEKIIVKYETSLLVVT